MNSLAVVDNDGAIEQRSFTFHELMETFRPLPHQCAVMGLAEDNLPVLLSLKGDSVANKTGPILVEGDGEDVIRTVAMSIGEEGGSEFALITASPNNWWFQYQNCIGVYPTYKNSSQDLIRGIYEWAASRSGRNHVVLLVTNIMDIFEMDYDFRMYFRLMVTSNYRNLTIVTACPKSALIYVPYLDLFTRVKHHGGSLFSLREGGKDLYFNTPSFQ